MAAILLQADEILVKPFDITQLAGFIEKRRNASGPSPTAGKESVATILDHDIAITVERWLSRVQEVPELAAIPLTPKERSEYLHPMKESITARLRSVHSLDLVDYACVAAVAHGRIRCRQGYTAPLIVQESRILQVCIFETIERNLSTVDFTKVLPNIMIIADEVDCQLKQTIDSFLTMEREEAALAEQSRKVPIVLV